MRDELRKNINNDPEGKMTTRLSIVELRPRDLADSKVATLHLECLDAEKRLRGANKMAATAVFHVRESRLQNLWARLAELDAKLCGDLQDAVRDWHDIAVRLRGGE
jgi:hypothetical protein